MGVVLLGVVLLRFATSTAGAGVGSPVRSEMPRDDPTGDPSDDPRDDLALAAQAKSLRRSSKLATAVRLLVLDLRSVASKPCHADAGGENADGQQWNELAPADGTAHLNGAAEDFGVEPGRVSTRRQCELGLFHRAATRPQTANGRDNRRQQEKTRERRGRGQRIVPLGQPDESDQENESGGHDPEYSGKERPDEKAGAETSLSGARSSRYFRQPPIQRFLPGLTCPHGPEQKAKRQRQSQRRIGALLQGLVDRVGHIVADFADRLDCFPSFVLGVRDDTSDICTCRHGSILSWNCVL